MAARIRGWWPQPRAPPFQDARVGQECPGESELHPDEPWAPAYPLLGWVLMAKPVKKLKRRGPEPEHLRIDLPPDEALRRLLQPIKQPNKRSARDGRGPQDRTGAD